MPFLNELIISFQNFNELQRYYFLESKQVGLNSHIYFIAYIKISMLILVVSLQHNLSISRKTPPYQKLINLLERLRNRLRQKPKR